MRWLVGGRGEVVSGESGRQEEGRMGVRRGRGVRGRSGGGVGRRGVEGGKVGRVRRW